MSKNVPFEVTFDYAEIQKALDRLTRDKCYEIIFDALIKGGEVLKKHTQESLVRKLGPGANSTASKKWKNKSMTSQISLTKYKSDTTVIVSLMEDGRLRWFEKGTAPRYRKTPDEKLRKKDRVKAENKLRKMSPNFGYTGSITGTRFFKEARDDGSFLETVLTELKKLYESELKPV